MDENAPPRVPPTTKDPPKTILKGGRCHWCGYSLKGLPYYRGNCPECGTRYSPESASFLQPSPGAFIICLRLGWPFLGLLLCGMPASIGVGELPAIFGIYALIVAVPINSYLQVRSMLKNHLPEQKRTQGFIFGLRALGTTIALLVLLVTLLPLIMCGACLFTGGWGM